MDKVTSNDIFLQNCKYKRYGINKAYCEIKTLEGVMIGKDGDYIMKSVNGKIYPCKADIFENTYEQADEKEQMVEKEMEQLKAMRNNETNSNYEK